MTAFFEVQKQLNQEQYQKDIQIRKHSEKTNQHRNWACALLAICITAFCIYLYANIELLPATNEQETIVSALFPLMLLIAGIWAYRDYAKKISQSFKRKHQEFIDTTMMG